MIGRIPGLVLAAAVAAAPWPAAAQTDSPGSLRLKSTVKVRRAWAARYQDSRHGPEVTERFNRTIKVGRSGALDLSNVAGDIVVTGGSGDEIRIEAIKRARSRSGDAQQLLEELRIEVSEMANRVEVRTLYPRNRRNYSASVDYSIAMPSSGSATLRTVSGDVRVTNVKGELRAESVSGDVVAGGAARLALLKTVSGDVELTEASSESEVTVSSVSGGLTVRGLKARSVDLNSISGDLLLTGITADRATVKTVSGSIEYSGPLARSGRYELTAHSGSLRLAISGTTGFEVEATTFNGDIRSDFPLTLRGSVEGSGRRSRLNRSIRGSYGDASAIVTLKSFSGDIVITKR